VTVQEVAHDIRHVGHAARVRARGDRLRARSEQGGAQVRRVAQGGAGQVRRSARRGDGLLPRAARQVARPARAPDHRWARSHRITHFVKESEIDVCLILKLDRVEHPRKLLKSKKNGNFSEKIVHHHQPINVPTAGARAFLMDHT
jgi:hypothetical protein